MLDAWTGRAPHSRHRSTQIDLLITHSLESWSLVGCGLDEEGRHIESHGSPVAARIASLYS